MRTYDLVLVLNLEYKALDLDLMLENLYLDLRHEDSTKL